MRLATAFLLAAVPTYAAAQPAPPAPPPRATDQRSTTDHRPVQPHPPPRRPVAKKPNARRPPPKPAPTPPATPPTPAPAPAPDTHKGSNTGLPLPRFAALRSDDVNFRRGPGTRYPIDWVYQRRDLPVQIEREFEVWRLVEDPEGSKGWVQAATLTGRRTAVISGAERTLRQSASDTSGPVAKLQKGVIVRLRSCEATSDWCQVQVTDYRGYIRRNEIWGILPGEVIQ